MRPVRPSIRLNLPADQAYLNTNDHGQVKATYEDYRAQNAERLNSRYY